MGFGEGDRPVARKQHSCIWCHELIVIGERHFKYVGIWEREFQNWRMHDDCIDAHKRETYDGEICDEAHQRGRTCDEKESVERKLAKDVNEVMADLLREKGVAAEVLDLIHLHNMGSVVVRDLFKEFVYDEERRVTESRRKAIEAGKTKVRAS